MSRRTQLLLVSSDAGLLQHWRGALRCTQAPALDRFESLPAYESHEKLVIWLDMGLPGIAPWKDKIWGKLLASPERRLIAASSHPKDDEAIAALDAGCAAYCHAFADGNTLSQVQQVVEAGHVWIGVNLMQKLIKTASQVGQAAAPQKPDWGLLLTAREKEIAILAANGASNSAISRECNISERTVKAHLSAIFNKLNVTDRLQLALRVHDIG